jgi:4-hydroxybenzoate polyprenyltransferase
MATSLPQIASPPHQGAGLDVGPRIIRLSRLLLSSARPGQWVKNLIVLVPLLFSGNATAPALVLLALGALVCFCGLSVTAYLVNDLVDRRRDTRHPEKSKRPIASGALAPRGAGLAALAIGVISLLGAMAVGPAFFAVACCYLLLIVAYNLILKELVIADVGAIAAGFLLRTFAGGLAIGVWLSEWLVIGTVLLSLILALGKRRAELIRLGSEAARHRPVLAHYDLLFLDQLISITTTACLVTYLLYCVFSATATSHSGLLFTAPFVGYGLFRYLYQVYRHEQGGSPEKILFQDKWFLANGCAYVVSVVVVLYLTAKT